MKNIKEIKTNKTTKSKTISTRITKQQYNCLLEEYNKLKMENKLLKWSKDICLDEKIKVLEEFFDWCASNGYDLNLIQTFFEYKQELTKKNRLKGDNYE